MLGHALARGLEAGVSSDSGRVEVAIVEMRHVRRRRVEGRLVEVAIICLRSLLHGGRKLMFSQCVQSVFRDI